MDKIGLRFIIYSVLAFSFFLGFPEFHYAAAIMVALVIRYKDQPEALFTAVESYNLECLHGRAHDQTQG